MSSGFVPVRQLVLVDLLSMVLGVRPGERAVVAVDTAAESGTFHLCAELRALAAHVGGRELRTLGLSEVDAGPRDGLLRRFRAGEPFVASMDERRGRTVEPERDWHPTPDAVLLVAGSFLLRPALATRWDASVYVETEVTGSAAEHLYREQVPEQQATWVLDNRRQGAPTLTYGAIVDP
ncbi:MAG: hypothetical protein WA892_07805 [Ornithinimicrobium sp.]